MKQTMHFKIRLGLQACVVILPLALAACSGDGRPLKEAVEIAELELKALVIKQPAGLLPVLFLNTGEPVKFSVEAINEANEIVDLSSNQRRWSVSGDGVASIDENGNFVASTQTAFSVNVQIGGLRASFPLTVINETLLSISEITGNASIERCIPQEFAVQGMFSEGSIRGLPTANWSVVDPVFGSVGTPNSEGTVQVTGRNAGELIVQAEVGGVAGTRPVVVEDTLQSIAIAPDTLSLRNNRMLPLGATGTYLRAGNLREVAITEFVDWELPENNGVATISNTAPDIGELSSTAIGNTRVTASCGNVRQQKALVVIDSDS